MIQILNIEPENYSRKAVEILERVGSYKEEALTREQILQNLSGVDVLITRLTHQINQEILAAAPNLKAIVSATTGLDHIDINTAAQRQIEVLCLKGEFEFLNDIHATAEHTWALLLALIRNLPAATEHVQESIWQRDRFKGHELHSKKLGLVGLGRIGRKIARYGETFGMEVSAYDPFASFWPDHVQKIETLESLAQQSDILSIHVPLNASTTHLINQNIFNLMSPHAYFINTSRGDIVDEVALLNALKDARIAGAATDVVSGERADQMQAHPLVSHANNHRNLIITPHIGGATYESMEKTEVFMAHKVVDFIKRLSLEQ